MRKIFAVALLSVATTANAGTDADRKLCATAKGGEKTISACTRLIANPRISDRGKAAAYFNRAVEHGFDRKFDLAISDLNQAIDLRPDYVDAINARGAAHAQNKNYDRSISDFSAAIRIDPSYQEAYYNRGYTYTKLGQYDRAISDLSNAIAIKSDYSDAIYWRGIAHADKRDYDRAIIDFSRLLELKPNDVAALNSRGRIFREKGNIERALEDLGRAIDLDPTAASPFYNRGNAFRRLGDLKRAIADFDGAIQLSPNSPMALTDRGVSHAELGDFERAISDFDEASRLWPEYVTAYYRRGIIYLNRGDRNRAIADYARAEALATDTDDSEDQSIRQHARRKLGELLDTSVDPAFLATSLKPPLRRLALVVANSRYTAIRTLTNPEPDATAVSKTLRDLGFEVTEERDLAKDRLKSAVRRFAAKVEKERPDWALVYYSGHGVETRRGALMLPVDILEAKDGEKPSIHDVEEDATAVGGVIERLQDTKALTLVVFDACREDGQLAEFARRLDMKAAGITTLRDVRGSGLRWGHNGILFSTAEGTYAWDGEPGQLSAFAKSFISAINTEGLELNDLVKKLYDDVEKTTAKVMKTPQRPEFRVNNGQIEGKHYFRPPGATATTAASQPKP